MGGGGGGEGHPVKKFFFCNREREKKCQQKQNCFRTGKWFLKHAGLFLHLAEESFMICNRPIVLLRPGHEVRGISTVRSCKKHCFLYFSEAHSLPSMASNDCFCFQLAWFQCVVMCSSNVGTGKSPDLTDFHPCRSRLSLLIAPGQLSWPELRKGDIQEEKSISR